MRWPLRVAEATRTCRSCDIRGTVQHMTLRAVTRALGRTAPESLLDTKAALLYVDEVSVQWARQWMSPDEAKLLRSRAAAAENKRDPEFVALLDEREQHMLSELALVERHGLLADILTPDQGLLAAVTEALLRERPESEPPEIGLLAALGVDPLIVPPDHVPLVGGDPLPRRLVFLVPRDADNRADVQLWNPAQSIADLSDPRKAANADAVEVAFAARLLGELPAFPRADMADILDVRQRLADARTRFRAAMATAGRDLEDVPAVDFERELDAYRRQHVEPVLLDIREELEELRAVPTLLRALREKWSVPTVASIAVAAAMFDPAAVVAIGTSSAGVALGAREALARRDVHRRVRQQPFWYLREVDRRLHARGS